MSTINNIVDQIHQLHKEIRSVMPLVQQQVNDAIYNKVTDTHYIENLLDDLLGIVPLGYGVEEFRKLNHYYAGIDPGNSAEYDKYLDEALE